MTFRRKKSKSRGRIADTHFYPPLRTLGLISGDPKPKLLGIES
jgi:hypothetical protein